jgi:hypothetical protein
VPKSCFPVENSLQQIQHSIPAIIQDYGNKVTNAALTTGSLGTLSSLSSTSDNLISTGFLVVGPSVSSFFSNASPYKMRVK